MRARRYIYIYLLLRQLTWRDYRSNSSESIRIINFGNFEGFKDFTRGSVRSFSGRFSIGSRILRGETSNGGKSRSDPFIGG